MIELRWLKENWEFGKFKLQYYDPKRTKCLGNHWVDVPIAEDKPIEKTLRTQEDLEMKYHQLSKLLPLRYLNQQKSIQENMENIDSIITQWLEEKAKEIKKCQIENTPFHQKIDSVLGLSQASEKTLLVG